MKPPSKITGSLYAIDSVGEETVFEPRKSMVMTADESSRRPSGLSPRPDVDSHRAPASTVEPRTASPMLPPRMSAAGSDRPGSVGSPDRPARTPTVEVPRVEVGRAIGGVDGLPARRPSQLPPPPSQRPPSIEFARPGVPRPPTGAAPRPGVMRPPSGEGSRPDAARPPSRDGARPDFSRRSYTTLPAIDVHGASDPSLVTERASATADRFVRNLLRSTHETDSLFVEPMRTLGVAGLDALVAAFPGPIRKSLLDPHNPPRGRDISAVAFVLHALGPSAHTHVRRLLTHENPRARHAATLLAQDMDVEAFREDIEARLFDEDGLVAAIAEHFVESRGTAKNDPLAMRLAAEVRSRSVPTLRRHRAATLIGKLRLERCLAVLVDGLDDPERPVAVAALHSLRVLTAHDFGTATRDWMGFVRDQRSRDRTAWLLDGLLLPNPRCRDLAAAELRRLTRETLGYVDGCSIDDARRVRGIYERMLSR